VTDSPVPDVPALLRRLLTADPGRPRVTWYGPDGERVELSAKVLDNWVAKTANLLVDEADAGPGSRVVLALPPHWRTVTWLLATWSTGACAVVAGPGGGLPAGDIVVGTDADALAAAEATGSTAVAVALPALALGYGPGLPPGVLDAAPAVRSHGDVFVPFVRPVSQDPAFDAPGGVLAHGELLAAAGRAARAAGLPDGVRLLTDGDPRRAVTDLLAPLLRGGSVLLHHDLPSLPPEALARLRTQESVTP